MPDRIVFARAGALCWLVIGVRCVVVFLWVGGFGFGMQPHSISACRPTACVRAFCGALAVRCWRYSGFVWREKLQVFARYFEPIGSFLCNSVVLWLLRGNYSHS